MKIRYYVDAWNQAQAMPGHYYAPLLLTIKIKFLWQLQPGAMVHHSITAIGITRCWLLGSINIQPLLKDYSCDATHHRAGSPRYRGLRQETGVHWTLGIYIETQSVTDIRYNLYRPLSVWGRGQSRYEGRGSTSIINYTQARQCLPDPLKPRHFEWGLLQTSPATRS